MPRRRRASGASTPPLRHTPEGPPTSQVSSLPAGSLTRVGLGAPGLTHPAGARAPSARAARAAAAQPLRALSALLSPRPPTCYSPGAPPPLAVTSRPASPLLLLVGFPQGAGQPPREPRAGVPSPVGGRGGGVTWAGGAPRDLRGHFGGVGALRTRVSERPSIPWAQWEAPPACSSLRKSRSTALSALHLPPPKQEYRSVTFCRKFLHSLPTSAHPAFLLACLISNPNQNSTLGLLASIIILQPFFSVIFII